MVHQIWPTFAEKATKLIDQDKVVVVFGGWTSASRKAMLPVFESKNHMLWYPVQYEGQECSKNIFYKGAADNQQIEPAVEWLLKNKGKEFFLVGSDYVFPRTANTIIKEQLKVKGGKTVGEDYLPLGNTEVTPIITKIKQALPKGGVIFNTLNGDSNVAFFKQIQAAGLNPDKYPVLSVSIAEEEVQQIGVEYLLGQYAAWNYFQTVKSPANEKFVKAFKAKYGENRVTNDPAEAAYIAVYLWKQAVEKAGVADDLDKVRLAAIGQELDAPNGQSRCIPIITFLKLFALVKLIKMPFLILFGQLKAPLFRFPGTSLSLKPKVILAIGHALILSPPKLLVNLRMQQ